MHALIVLVRQLFTVLFNDNRISSHLLNHKNVNVIMSQAAKGLSDEDIQGLATYLQGLHKAGKPTAK